MSVRLETRQLTKNFGNFAAVSDVSLSFEPGLIHAVLGENGAGKSTLLKMLFGLIDPSSGEVILDGKTQTWRGSLDAIRAGLGMVQQHFSLVDTLSVIDNIMLGAEVCRAAGLLDRKAAIRKLEALLPRENLSVPWNAKVASLTVGQKQRVEILKLLFRESKILFLDEPTAVLTPSEIEDLFSVLRHLKKSGCTIVLITHKIREVLEVCDTYTVLRRGRLITRGSTKQAQADDIVESMIGRKILPIEVERKTRRLDRVFDCRGVRDPAVTSRASRREHGGLRDITIQVHAGEIVGVAGVEGSGQSLFVESILGLRDFEGEMSLCGQRCQALSPKGLRDLGIGLVPEDRHHQGLWMDESCSNNMIIGMEDRFVENLKLNETKINRETGIWATEFDLRAASLDVPVRTLSGGNQQKVIFAREVTGRDPQFLICHQPTRGVDLGAMDLIHRKLIEKRNEGLGVLVLSSELDELFKVCDRLYVFFEGRVVAEFARRDFDAFKVGSAMTGATHAH